MITMLNACTTEIDDPDDAVADILGQLDLDKRLLKNAVGIIACFSECIVTGVVAALCERLPFDVVGCTTTGNSACGKYGRELLSLAVLTSDDTSFATAMSEPLSHNKIIAPLSTAYNAARQGREPDFILAYAPLMFSMGEHAIAGSVIFNSFNTVVGGKPLFGTFSCDHTLNCSESRVLRNGEAAIDTAAMILMFGKVNPRFYVTAIPEVNITRQTAVITNSEGTLLKELNGMSPVSYMETLGITRKSMEVGGVIALMLNYNDGTDPVVLGIYGITPEGYLVCGGDVPVNALLSVGSLNYHGVLESTETTIQKISGAGEVNGILMYPCLSRKLMLGQNADDEMKKVFELIGDRYPYQLCYAGGEICPLLDEQGKPVNRFHNYSFILCVL
ncbi:MAG: FIST C-terminal domain-containing protein [Spirochaetaceae bacterium]|jgi:hypothetical protein|nr:FIST C-terminal domain-containing protein [Spirochaetaceae bacterium]